MSPEKSKVYEENESGIELFERKLHEILEKRTEEIALLPLGDFNARTARELNHLEDQEANDNITEDIYEHDGFNLPRDNKDTEKNNYGEELLELCKNYNVHVLNGRLDRDSKGEITCIANDGASTVDYVIVNTRLFDKINSFEIIQRVESDHFPICCTLRISHGLPLDPTNSNVHLQPLTRFKYSNRGDEAFLENIQKEETDTKLNSLSQLSRVANKHITDSQLFYRNMPLILGPKALAREAESNLFCMIKIVTTRKKKNIDG